MQIAISPGISIDEREVEVTFLRSSGPGGQNVNKVATAVQLRFDARNTLALPNNAKARLQTLAGTRLTRDGVIVITADRFRSQERNRQDALARLAALIRQAATPPAKRIPTRVSAGQKRQRLESKLKRSAVKRDRGRHTPQD